MSQQTRDTLESIAWSFVGNLLPIWFAALISIFNDGLSWECIIIAIHQPYTFLILSASYLTTTSYLMRKGNNKTNPIFSILYIVLFLLIGFLVSKKDGLENFSVNDETIIGAYFLFGVSFIFYAIYQYRFFDKRYNVNYSQERAQGEERLSDDFDALN